MSGEPIYCEAARARRPANQRAGIFVQSASGIQLSRYLPFSGRESQFTMQTLHSCTVARARRPANQMAGILLTTHQAGIRSPDISIQGT